MKTEIVVERIDFRPAETLRPLTVRIVRGARSMVVTLTDEEALELAGSIREAVQAERKTRGRSKSRRRSSTICRNGGAEWISN